MYFRSMSITSKILTYIGKLLADKEITLRVVIDSMPFLEYAIDGEHIR